MLQKTKAQVRIYGNEYTLVGNESEEYINSVCFAVDKKMREIAKNPILKPMKVSVLTAINFCDEYFKATSKLEEAISQLQKAKEEIIELKSEVAALEEEKKYLKDEIQTIRKSGY
ncbi:MAG: cell division protein ZapA [Clostridia bacterium]|nr:cell division protein ZapA [Clostridia bacterium]